MRPGGGDGRRRVIRVGADDARRVGGPRKLRGRAAEVGFDEALPRGCQSTPRGKATRTGEKAAHFRGDFVLVREQLYLRQRSRALEVEGELLGVGREPAQGGKPGEKAEDAERHGPSAMP